MARSAFEHLRAAGLRAAERGDAPTAASLLRHAIDLRDPDDPERLELAWVLGFALSDSGSIPEAIELLSDADRLRAEAVGNERAAAYARCVLVSVQMFGESRGQRRGSCKETAERALALFEAEGDERGQALAWSTTRFAQWFEEHVEDARAVGRARDRSMRERPATA